jgi:Ca2+-binding EF-hand superfamily protein
MKYLSIIGLSVIVAASLSTTVLAEGNKGAHKADKAEQFKKADANGDGKLSLAEFKTMCTKGDAEAKFAAADTDKDGFLTPEELKAAHAKHAKKNEAACAVPAPVAPAPVAPAK